MKNIISNNSTCVLLKSCIVALEEQPKINVINMHNNYIKLHIYSTPLWELLGNTNAIL